MEPKLQPLYTAILEGDKDSAEESVRSATSAGWSPSQLLEEAIISTTSEVGRRFEEGEYYVPEMLVAVRAMRIGADGYALNARRAVTMIQTLMLSKETA